MLTVKCGSRMRKAVEVICENCEKQFLKSEIATKETNRHFCSQECYRAKVQAKHMELICDQCGEPFNWRVRNKSSKSGLRFCSRKCKDQAQRIGGLVIPSHYGTTEFKYREIAFRNYPKKCEMCDYDTYEQGLEVHHLDGDRQNNDKCNLMVLCGTCHRLVTFGVLVFQGRQVATIS